MTAHHCLQLLNQPQYHFINWTALKKILKVLVHLCQCSIEDIPKSSYISETVTLKIILKDTKGQCICNAKHLITVQVTKAIFHTTVSSIVNELGNGEYSVSFIPTDIGDHIINIKVQDAHLLNSPLH